MRCLSLWQPWASLLVSGQKRVETRSWRIAHRGPLLIHAAKRWEPGQGAVCADPIFRRALEAIGYPLTANMQDAQRAWGMPLGAIVGSVDVEECFPTEKVHECIEGDGEPGRFLNDLVIDFKEQLFGDYSPGRFAFLCTNPVRFAQPIPFRGAQGLFEANVPASCSTGGATEEGGG